MSKIPVSVCIIAKNEERFIEECLKRLLPYGLEIVVTDTGSTDRTRETALKYADKVLDFEWTDDFSAARNFCARNASNDWILALDCDEYVTRMDIPMLKRYIKAFPDKTGALHLKNLMVKNNNENEYRYGDIIRLYNRKYFTFMGAIHEQIRTIKGEPVYDGHFIIPMDAVHYGYALEPDAMKEKQERNLRMLYNRISKDGEDSYSCFQIAQSEFVLKNYDAAIEYYEKGIAFDKPRDLVYVQDMIEGLAISYMITGRKKEALGIMNRYESECDSPRYIYYHANVLRGNGEDLKALVKFIKVTTLPNVEKTSEELVNSYKQIIEIYHKFSEHELAKFFEEKYAECLKERDGHC